MNIKLILSILLSSFIVTACGGGGGGGSSTPSITGSYEGATTPATVTASNSADIGETALLGTAKALESNSGSNIPLAADIEVNAFMSDIVENITETISIRGSIPTGFIITESCFPSGNFTVDFVGLSENAQSVPQNGTINITYNNCDDGYGILNGTASFVYNGWSDSQGFKNYTVVFDLTISGIPYEGTVQCSNYGDSCTEYESFSDGGTTYRIEESSVSGNNFSGYDVTVTVYNSGYGYIAVSATGITIDESTGNICTGTITVSDSTGVVMTVTFPDCDSFVVTYNGNANTYLQ